MGRGSPGRGVRADRGRTAEKRRVRPVRPGWRRRLRAGPARSAGPRRPHASARGRTGGGNPFRGPGADLGRGRHRFGGPRPRRLPASGTDPAIAVRGRHDERGADRAPGGGRWMIGVARYRRTGSALHRVRTGVAIAYCCALVLPAFIFGNPIVLGATLTAIALAAASARVRRELVKAAALAVPLAVLVAAINPLVSQQGLTVLLDGPVVPVLGNVDVTLEALVFGAVAGLRVLVVLLGFALYSTCVDPDRVLRLVGRIAPRSALTASLATRSVPLLIRDASRLSEAYLLR